MPRALVALLALLVLVLGGCGGDGGGGNEGASGEFHPIAGGFEPDETALEDCPAAENRYACREQAYGNLAYEEGGKAALARVAEDMAADPEIESGCHRIVHIVGSATLARENDDVGRAFVDGDSTCWSGFYHGILERALFGATNDVLLGEAVRRICADVMREESRFIAYQCVHGIGHGLMIQTGLDLPRSLEHCERLETEWEQTSCDGGVFMENFNTSYGVSSKYVSDDNVLYPCTWVKERHKLYCYLQITDRLLSETGYDWKRAATLCTQAEPDWRATCFQSLGRSASGTARLDHPLLLSYCRAAPKEWHGDCVYGAVRDIASNDAGGARAARFCTEVDEPLRARCFYGLGTILSGIETTAEGLAAACAAVPQRYRPECRLERAA